MQLEQDPDIRLDHQFAVSKANMKRSPQPGERASEEHGSDATMCVVEQKPCTDFSRGPTPAGTQSPKDKLRPRQGKSHGQW